MPTPKPRTLSDIKSKLLHPALTSHFEILITPPSGLTDKYLSENNINFNVVLQDKLQLLCSEASLPGSNLATLEINNDYTGVTERHVYRRIYDDRIDLTFYVDAEDYLPIRFFETWIKYAVGENVGNPKDGAKAPVGSKNPNYFYRVRYPKYYISEDGLTVTKFERTNSTNQEENYTPKSTLEYKFINCFPISITSMPVSYDTSTILKCTVSMSYIRYYLNYTSDQNDSERERSSNDISAPNFDYGKLTPDKIAEINKISFNPQTNLGSNYEKLTTTGGVNYSSTLFSGNRVNTGNVFNSNLNLGF